METEKQLSEYLDDLLVQDGILPKRKLNFLNDSSGFGMLLHVKEDPRIKFKIEMYPNETEEPHFKIIYQNYTCRFRIVDCKPMKAEIHKGVPQKIQKIMKQIKKMWADNKDLIIECWSATRPSDQHHGHQKIR